MCTTRICNSCKQEKLATSEFFYKDKNKPLGLMYRCKECDKKRPDNRNSKERYKNMTLEQKLSKKEKAKEYSKTVKGKAIHKINSYLKYDKTKGFETNISQDFIIKILESNCSYCGYSATGIDRLNNSIGHIETNSIPCCKECNIARGDSFTYEEMLIIGKTIKKIKDGRKYDPPHFELS